MRLNGKRRIENWPLAFRRFERHHFVQMKLRRRGQDASRWIGNTALMRRSEWYDIVCFCRWLRCKQLRQMYKWESQKSIPLGLPQTPATNVTFHVSPSGRWTVGLRADGNQPYVEVLLHA